MNKVYPVLMILISQLVFAQENYFDKDDFIKNAETKKVLRLGLMDCITYALKNNAEIKIVAIKPEIMKDEVRVQESAFEPVFGIEYLFAEDIKISAIPFLTGDLTDKRKTTVLNASASGMLYPGTKYKVEFLNTRYESNSLYQTINPSYETEPKVTITQPVMRGFGVTINRAGITIAKNTEKMTEEMFKSTVMDIISAVKTAYYNYIYSRKAYSIARSSVKRTRELFLINRARYKKGLISSVDLLEIETALSEKIKYLITAESYLKKTEDELKMITNLVDDPEVWNAKLELTDMPEYKVQKLDLIDSLEDAFKYRPDYFTKKIDLENKNVSIMVTKNALLPTIDLIGSFGLNGLGSSYGDAIDTLDTKYKDWSAGVGVTIPWGSGDRARYNKAQLEKKQALIELKRLEQKIILEVRDKVREVDIQYRQVNTAKISKQKENQNYKAQKERYSAGEVSTHDILDYQDKLARSELDYIKSLIDYNIAIINLEKAEGVTLVKNNIKLEER